MAPVDRLLVALAAVCIAAALGYAAIRVAELALFTQANPRAIFGDVSSPFAWRCALALYVGGMGGFGGHALSGRSPAAAARWLRRGAVAAAVVIAAQAALAP